MLRRVEFENFRGFRKLMLDGLQRVNLIVGRNNSGKTSCLEGVAILLTPFNAPDQIAKLRQLEQELRQQFFQQQYAGWVIHDESVDKSARLSGVWAGQERNFFLVPTSAPTRTGVVVAQPAPETEKRSRTVQLRGYTEIRSCVISAQHNTPENLVQSLGSAVRRRGGEELLESALRSVDPRVRKVRIVPSEQGTQVVVDIGLSRLVPLSQVGQGTYRLVEMFSAIIGADARAAFIDELENGIHHTCLIDVWKGIAEAAERFDVQVFATTHSHECIEAAHAAFVERNSYCLAIIQLFRESGEIQGRVLDQKHIEAAIAGDIDLRG